MSEWHDMLAQAKALGINTHGLKKDDVEAAIHAATSQAPAELDAPPEEKEAAADFARGDRVPIGHTNGLGHWWCPICDHSQTGLIRECRGCGAVRDGDEVVTP